MSEVRDMDGMSKFDRTVDISYLKKYGSIQKAIIRYGKQLEVYFEDKVGESNSQ